jgi:PTS system N-acetylgalactosamine-specific IIA component
MKYVILVSHGVFAQGLQSAVLMMSGNRDDVLSTSLEDGASTEVFKENFIKLIDPIQSDDEVLLFCDILSGSPFSTSIEVLDSKGLIDNTMVFAGMNMPMVLTAVLMKDNLEGEVLKQTILDEAHLGVVYFHPNEVNTDTDDEDL